MVQLRVLLQRLLVVHQERTLLYLFHLNPVDTTEPPVLAEICSPAAAIGTTTHTPGPVLSRRFRAAFPVLSSHC